DVGRCALGAARTRRRRVQVGPSRRRAACGRANAAAGRDDGGRCGHGARGEVGHRRRHRRRHGDRSARTSARSWRGDHDRPVRVRDRACGGPCRRVRDRETAPAHAGRATLMFDILVPIAIILLLVVANGLFVAAEFAIVGAPRANIEHQAAQGSRLARSALRILEDPKLQDRYIATTQIGISVASLGLGMYGEHWMADHIAQWLGPLETTGWIAAHTVASVIAIAVLTYLHIVLGEMVPKALALQRAQKTILYISPVIRALERALLPLVVALNAFGTGLLKLVGIKRQRVERERYHTAEELQFIVQESKEGGLLRGESGQLLRDLFEFGDRPAGEAMGPRGLLVR